MVDYSGDLASGSSHHQVVPSVRGADWTPEWWPSFTYNEGADKVNVIMGEPRHPAVSNAAATTGPFAVVADACSSIRCGSCPEPSVLFYASTVVADASAVASSSCPAEACPARAAAESLLRPGQVSDACEVNCNHGIQSPLTLLGINGGKDALDNDSTLLSAVQLSRIEATKAAARKRKDARMRAMKDFLPVLDAGDEPAGKIQAPDTAPRGGGRPDICNRRYRETKGREANGHNGPAWPNDKTISLSDVSHRGAGFFAVDTVNPNAWSAGADYMSRTAADILLIQEVKLPEGDPCDAAEQAARNAKWKMSTEPCLITAKGGRSAGTAVAARNYIGMSMPEAVETTQELHAKGHFAMRRVAAMGKGGVHCGSAYLFSEGGIAAKWNLDLLDTMAFTISGLIGPWIIGGDWNCTPAELEATGWLKKVGDSPCTAGRHLQWKGL